MWKFLRFISKVAQAARRIQGSVLAPLERLLERLVENNYTAGRDEVKSWPSYVELEMRVGEVLGRYGVAAEAVPAVMNELLPVGLEWLDGVIPEEEIEPVVEALRRL